MGSIRKGRGTADHTRPAGPMHAVTGGTDSFRSATPTPLNSFRIHSEFIPNSFGEEGQCNHSVDERYLKRLRPKGRSNDAEHRCVHVVGRDETNSSPYF